MSHNPWNPVVPVSQLPMVRFYNEKVGGLFLTIERKRGDDIVNMALTSGATRSIQNVDGMLRHVVITDAPFEYINVVREGKYQVRYMTILIPENTVIVLP